MAKKYLYTIQRVAGSAEQFDTPQDRAKLRRIELAHKKSYEIALFLDVSEKRISKKSCQLHPEHLSIEIAYQGRKILICPVILMTYIGRAALVSPKWREWIRANDPTKLIQTNGS